MLQTPMNFVSNIAYKREGVSDSYAWQKIGRLYTDGQRWKIMLHAFRFGLCIARPRPGDPFLRGEIVAMMGKDPLFVGAICATENAKGENVYSIMLEAMPFRQAVEMWFDIRLDDEKGACPFE